MALGHRAWKKVRAVLQHLFAKASPELRDNAELRAKCMFKMGEVKMLLPAQIGDYSDFYASKEHATNLGRMFRPDGDALLPNWYVPTRASSSTSLGSGSRLATMGAPPPLSCLTPLFGVPTARSNRQSDLLRLSPFHS